MTDRFSSMSRSEARRFGADAIGCVAIEVLAVVVTVAVLTYFATGLSGPTVIGLAIVAFIVGNILFTLPIIGVILSVLASLWWGTLAFNLADGFGNLFLGIVAGVLVFLASLSLHVGVRD